MYTTKCVRCFKPAKIWGGHVLRGKEHVIAGWCSARCSEAAGFSGQHTERMGIVARGPHGRAGDEKGGG